MDFLCGAIPTPRERLAAATPFLAPLLAIPTSYGVVPTQLSMWLNDTYGDCVSAEEAFTKAAWSTAIGLPETFIPDANVKTWAKAHGVLNGAVIEDVLKWMMADPMMASDGKAYHNGPYTAVDFSNESTLNAAIYLGKSVKIGVDHRPLSSALNQTGGKSGWHVINSGRYQILDHCTALPGYGPANDLYEMLKIPLPSAVPPALDGHLLYTWGTIGFVDQQSMVGMTGEAWVRNPGTAEQPTPAPTPPPGPTPIPPVPIPPTPIPGGEYIFIDPAHKTYYVPADWVRSPTPSSLIR